MWIRIEFFSRHSPSLLDTVDISESFSPILKTTHPASVASFTFSGVKPASGAEIMQKVNMVDMFLHKNK